MAYHHLLLSPPPPHPRLSLVTSRRRPRAGHVAAACSPSPSALAAGRRAVLLVGVSVLPLLRLRDAAFAAAAARPPSTTTVDLVTDRIDTAKTEETQPEEPSAEESLAEVKVPPAVNPLAGLLNAIAVIASGVFAGLFGASQREKEALQSTVSTMEIKLAENEAAMSMLRENYEKQIWNEHAEQKKQARMFQEKEASLLDQLTLTKRTVTSLNEEVRREKELVEQLKQEIHRLKSSIAQAEDDKHVFEGKLREKLEALDSLQDKVNLLSQEVNSKEEAIRELSSSLSSKEEDYQKLQLIYNETEASLEYANSKIEQLEEDYSATKDDLNSKMSSIDSLNKEVQTLYTAKTGAEEKISELKKQYADLAASSEMRASCDSELLIEKDNLLNQLEEKLSAALSDTSKNKIIIAELNNELDTNRTMLDNEVEAHKKLSEILQSTEGALTDYRDKVFNLSEELNRVKISNQQLITQITKLTDESNITKQVLSNKIAEAEAVSKVLSDELASVRDVLQKTQEKLDVTSNQLVSTMEAREDLNKELLDAYKKLESATDELVRERKINATLNRELEALVEQSIVESEARQALQADLDEVTNSQKEVDESTQFLSERLDTANSRISSIEEKKEMLSEALEQQKRSTMEAQKGMEDAQNLIKMLGTERENFEIRSKKLEEELATAKGEILRLRRQISASGYLRTELAETSVTSNTSQPEQDVNDPDQNSNNTDAGDTRSPTRIYRRRKTKRAT
uniref:MAR-binding filament-like protein 1 n=1 Tax=Oryza rufipogon TaxID=4529 RepID=A0A0E0PIA7_ORYRU